MTVDDPLILGACCACGKEDLSVRNVICLDKEAPQAGTGWGCVVCGLPADGALAVICDECRVSGRPLAFAVLGFVTRHRRIPIEELTRSFSHRLEVHCIDDAVAEMMRLTGAPHEPPDVALFAQATEVQ